MLSLRFMRPFLSFSLPFLLYILTLAPTIYNLDSAELTTATATLGITRATGYPLYTLLGFLWSKIPIGDVGYRLNLFSAFFGALTIFITDRLLAKWKISWIASFGALGLLATAPYFWGLSLIAEVYTLHTALVAGILFFLVKWDDNPSLLNLLGVAFLTGLSLTNHVSSVLLLPGILFYLISSHLKEVFRVRKLLPAIFVGIAAISLYLYLPIREGMHPVFNYAGIYDEFGVFHPIKLNTWDGFWWLVSGKGFHNLMFSYKFRELLPQIIGFIKELSRSFWLIGIGPGIFGLAILIYRKRKVGILLTLWFCFVAGFYINYRVLDKATMYLPCYLIWAIMVAWCYQEFIAWLNKIASSARQIPTSIFKGVLAILVIFICIWNLPLTNKSDERAIRSTALAYLDSLPKSAVVIGYWDTIPAMEYLQKVEGIRPDVKLINRFLISPENFTKLLINLSTSNPLFISGYPPILPANLQLYQNGELYQIVLSNTNPLY